ncbi:MAG: response regulator [Desulfomonile tiedjei]|uniref:histidine kinase n=1 Tax=Desulfomonile tiedjei TaxID=2358 RepID=A0A9D6V0C4_9BACT|nr:response regulator [Desulfomonile tiedjei]
MFPQKRILVVDDDRQNVELLKNMLESLGHVAEVAYSGIEAIGKLDQNIDLVLLDVMMPVSDGFEIAGRIRSNPEFGDLPIIMVTILDSKQDRLRAVESGANDFISKPIDMLELRVRVTSLLKMKNAQDRIKSSLREKEILLREIHHRVKNNLAIVSSLLSLQSRYTTDEFHRGMFKDAQNRIRSMALAHEKLYLADNLAALKMNEYIDGLVDHLLVSFKTLGKPIRLVKNLEEVYLGLETVVPVGIILTELLSNCFKHAFPDDRRGEIAITLLAKPENTFELIVADNGVGIRKNIDLSNPDSFGLNLVKTFAQQIGGKIDVNSIQGTKFSLEFKNGKAKHRVGGPYESVTNTDC